jgi:hypothetical protein
MMTVTSWKRKALVKGEKTCSEQRHDNGCEHLWSASQMRYPVGQEATEHQRKLTMNVSLIHHFRRSIELPCLTACAGIAVVRAVKKKSPSAVYFDIVQLAAFPH